MEYQFNTLAEQQSACHKSCDKNWERYSSLKKKVKQFFQAEADMYSEMQMSHYGENYDLDNEWL